MVSVSQTQFQASIMHMPIQFNLTALMSTRQIFIEQWIWVCKPPSDWVGTVS